MDSSIKKQWMHSERVAGAYDEIYCRDNSNHSYKIEQITDTLLGLLDKNKPSYDFLEIGAGTGLHARHFLEHQGPRIQSLTLSDLSEGMLQNAKDRLKAFSCVRYLVAPAETMETDRRFDAVYMSGAMHHFANPRQAILNCQKLLGPGGILVVCEPNVWNPVNLVRALVSPVDWQQFRVTRAQVKNWLTEAGYRIESNRVLHWRGRGAWVQKLWPFQTLEKIPLLNAAAVMFLIGARKISE